VIHIKLSVVFSEIVLEEPKIITLQMQTQICLITVGTFGVKINLLFVVM